jgi:hypothetical protein
MKYKPKPSASDAPQDLGALIALAPNGMLNLHHLAAQ